MAVHSSGSVSIEMNPVRVRAPLPWWTWIAPFFIANLATWLSLWFKTDPGISYWYLPTAFGIVMVYWWGPRALLGVYLNAVVCAPLWDLPWQWSLLSALPETVEVGLSWLLFVKLLGGKYWLPNLKHIGLFIVFGSVAPAFVANAYLVSQQYLLNEMAQNTIWNHWWLLFSRDLVTQFVFTVPVLIIFTKSMNNKGWTQVEENISYTPFLINNGNSRVDIILIFGAFLATLILITLPITRDVWGLYGLLMILLAIRYGVNVAVLGASWIGILTLLTTFLAGGLENLGDSISTNVNIFCLCGAVLIVGRAINDFSEEVYGRNAFEKSLLETESKYRNLVERIPSIIYLAEFKQKIGVTYISPQIEALGFTQAEWVADPELWFRQIHSDDQKRVLADIEQSRDGDETIRSEYRLLTRDGNLKWFLDEAVDVRDNDGKALFRQGFMLDITARKLAEETLSARERYLELLNDMTQTALLSKDIDATLHTLAIDLAKMIGADDCYITRWDAEKQLMSAEIVPANLASPDARPNRNMDELGMTASVIKAGQTLAVEDALNSPFINPEVARRSMICSVLGIPLVAGESKLGAATITFNDPHHFTLDELERVEYAGRQIALALQYLRQDADVQQRLKESNALAQIGRALSATEHTGTGQVLQLIVNSARDLIPQAEESVIHLLNPEEQVLIAQAVSGFVQDQVFSRVQMKLGEGVAGQVINQGTTINIGDVENDSRFVRTNSLPNFRSLLVAPVKSGDQQIGTISVQSNKKFAFTTDDAELLNALGIQAAIAIENTRLFETTQQQLKEVDALYKTSQGLAASLDTDQLINDIVLLLYQNFGYYFVQIYLVNAENGDLVLKSSSGRQAEHFMEDGFKIPRGTGIVGHVAETGEPFVTNNVNAVVFFDRNPLLPDTQSELTVPIKVDRQVVGVLDIQHTPPNRFTNDELRLMTAVADQLAAALQKANLYKDLQIALQQETNIRSQLIQNERLALVGRLLASVSHELNNPLQAIQNALFLLKDETKFSEQASQDLKIILAETERMAVLIEQLRATYRPVRKQDFLLVQLNNLIEDVHMLISTHMRHKEIAFEYVPDPELPGIWGLSDQLRQVVLNLFLNAVEVMKPGGRLTVLTRSLPQQNEILITVKDTGPGIDMEILPHIFEPFVTSKYTGTGLGLTITHDIIQQHHGRIQAENDPQGGAIFNIWLPLDEKV